MTASEETGEYQIHKGWDFVKVQPEVAANSAADAQIKPELAAKAQRQGRFKSVPNKTIEEQ